MGAEPTWVFTACGAGWEIQHEDGRRQSSASDRSGRSALEVLDKVLDERHVPPAPGAPDLPFFGGAVGWLSYDLGRHFERVDGTARDDLQAPDIRLAWYDAAIVWDHTDDAVWLVSADSTAWTISAGDKLVAWLNGPAVPFESDATPPAIAQSNLGRQAYMDRVGEIRDGIARGEFYQLNLVQRFDCVHRELPACTYLRLREQNPAPFAAYLDADEFAVLSSSPERFLEVTPAGQIRTCPIKGTRPRGSTAEADARLRHELVSSAKERAELLMIVDLLRNDLGRVCQPGSVKVVRLHALESFATVHHLVSEVHGELRPDVTRRELLRAVFPGGSITGAPKVSAMRAIDRLEPHRRGIGMGSLGYFSCHGRIDLNIAIRTIVATRGRAYVPVGAGIVWDSDPASEYAETLAKARALFAALGVTASEP